MRRHRDRKSEKDKVMNLTVFHGSFSEGNKTKTAEGMIAKDGEYVPFTVATDCSGEVEVTAITQSSSSRKLTQFYNIISDINYNT